MAKQDYYRSQFRLPQNLYEQLKASADANGKSVNAELVSRLESTFSIVNEIPSRVEEVSATMKSVAQRLDEMEKKNQELDDQYDEIMHLLAAMIKQHGDDPEGRRLLEEYEKLKNS